MPICSQMNQTLSQRSVDLAASNRQLKQEIVQRKSVEESLRKSEQHYSQLLEQSRQMQEQLRLLSRQLLSAQEEERKKISRELHDVIAQTLTGINVRLATLKSEATLNTKGLERNIARTQQTGGEIGGHRASVRPRTAPDGVGRPGADSRPPYVHEKLCQARRASGLSLTAFAAVEQLDGDKRTVLFRVAQEALTNVARHAQASRVEVSIQKLAGAVCMKIKDDGKCFHVERVLHANGGKRSGTARHEGTIGDGRRQFRRRIRAGQRHHRPGADSVQQGRAGGGGDKPANGLIEPNFE